MAQAKQQSAYKLSDLIGRRLVWGEPNVGDQGGLTLPIYASEQDMKSRVRLTFMPCTGNDPLYVPFNLGKPYVAEGEGPKPSHEYTFVLTVSLKDHSMFEDFIVAWEQQTLEVMFERREAVFKKPFKSIDAVEGAKKKNLIIEGKLYDKRDKHLPPAQRRFDKTDNNVTITVLTAHENNKYGPTALHVGKVTVDPETGKKTIRVWHNVGSLALLTARCHVVPVITTAGTYVVAGSWGNKLTARELVIFPAEERGERGSMLNFDGVDVQIGCADDEDLAELLKHPDNDLDASQPPPPPSSADGKQQQQPQQQQPPPDSASSGFATDAGTAAGEHAAKRPRLNDGSGEGNGSANPAEGEAATLASVGGPPLLKAPRKNRTAAASLKPSPLAQQFADPDTTADMAGSPAFQLQ